MRYLPLYLFFLLIVASCASIGRPEGGARDEEPPVFVSSNPAPGTTNMTAKRITVTFNENIQLEDAFSKVVTSPPSKTPPTVRANGKHLTVEFRDTLVANATYTIDFADAIKDLNEGNILDGFALEFSTGDSIDSLRISGMVLEAKTLEPQQGMLVGIHSNLSDTALTTLPFERIARTNQYGQFTVRGMAPGRYRVYAVDDVNRDYKWDRSERLAFYEYTVSPTVETIAVGDTLRDKQGEDSLVFRQGWHYLPDDILLMAFNEDYNPQYIKDYLRPERNRININFAAKSDSLAELTIVDGVDDSLRGLSWREWALMAPNPTRDTLDYWIINPEVIASDSLRLALRYMKEDTANQLAWTSDTLRFFFREPKNAKQQKPKEEEADTVPDIPNKLSVRIYGSATQDINKPLRVEFSEPLASIDSSAIHIELLKDTLWIPLTDGTTMLPDTLSPLLRRVWDIKWEPDVKYRIIADSAAFVSVYGQHNPRVEMSVTTKKPDDYSTVIFHIAGLDSIPAYLQLLSSGDEAQFYGAANSQGVVEIPFVTPGTYYARLFLDANRNGVWDTGDYASGVQPEETFYYQKKLVLKQNWDLEETWDIYATPVDMQKPYAIKKNKPKLKRGEKAPGEDEGSEFDAENEEYNPFGGRNTGGRNNNRNQNGLNRRGMNSIGNLRAR